MWTGPGLVPEHSKKFAKEKAILYMVLAIGARLTDYGDASPSSSDEWAHHFYERAGVPTDSFEETSLLGTHLLLMRVRLSFLECQVTILTYTRLYMECKSEDQIWYTCI